MGELSIGVIVCGDLIPIIIISVNIYGNVRVINSCSEETAQEDWQVNHEAKLRRALADAAEAAVSRNVHNDEIKSLLKSTAERQLEHSLSKHLSLARAFREMTVLHLKSFSLSPLLFFSYPSDSLLLHLLAFSLVHYTSYAFFFFHTTVLFLFFYFFIIFLFFLTCL